ncbi:SseB family protein [Streptomyces sp. NPDC002680]|uniref:SseB family protein n=1 Tax=Streptomyces sp. NPDC002680 TaxID=3364659 RepID=UPI0036A4D652
METPTRHHTATPARRALDALAGNSEDPAALDVLARSDVLVPVPDDVSDADAGHPSTVALPVLQEPDGREAVPVFTSESELAGLLPAVSRYRLVPLGALADQWPTGDLALTIDAASPHGLTITSEGVRNLLARPYEY